MTKSVIPSGILNTLAQSFEDVAILIEKAPFRTPKTTTVEVLKGIAGGLKLAAE